MKQADDPNHRSYYYTLGTQTIYSSTPFLVLKIAHTEDFLIVKRPADSQSSGDISFVNDDDPTDLVRTYTLSVKEEGTNIIDFAVDNEYLYVLVSSDFGSRGILQIYKILNESNTEV